MVLWNGIIVASTLSPPGLLSNEKAVCRIEIQIGLSGVQNVVSIKNNWANSRAFDACNYHSESGLLGKRIVRGDLNRWVPQPLAFKVNPAKQWSTIPIILHTCSTNEIKSWVNCLQVSCQWFFIWICNHWPNNPNCWKHSIFQRTRHSDAAIP